MNSDAAQAEGLSDACVKWYHRGIYAQIAGILVMSITFFISTPPVMLACFPVGAGRIGIGLLIWATLFFKSL